MPLDQISTIFVILGFFIFLGYSYYHLKRKSFWQGQIALVLLSYIQGLILSVLFTSTNIFSIFIWTIIFSIIYYWGFSKFVSLIDLLKSALLKSLPSLDNPELTDIMIKLWNIPQNKINILTFSGKNSKNAFTPVSFGLIKIFVGEQLINELSRNELIFVLSHEIAHQYHKIFTYCLGLFPFVYIVICWIFIFTVVSMGILNISLFFVFTLILYILGIVIMNKISWLNEYVADKEGLIKTNDFPSAESMLTKILINQKDYGILNIVLYDHPPLKERIQNLKN